MNENIKKIGQYTSKFSSPPVIRSFASVVGQKEGEGPLHDLFDKIYEDSYLGEDSWEKAESDLQKKVAGLAINKAKLKPSDIDYILAGDLLNQCIASTYGLEDLNIPLIGLFGACSTMALSVAVGSMVVASGSGKNVVAVTSSHFCTAERQFRFPLEYGGQRTPTSQWTVTGAGSLVIGDNSFKKDNSVFVDKFCIGKVLDMEITDTNNMGAAMAGAASTTLSSFLKDTNTSPDDYDLIVTGDLGVVGSEMLKTLLLSEGIKLGDNYNDCGLMIFDMESQNVNAGGSGCGCSASVLCSKLLRDMEDGKMSNILFMATGALMSPTSVQQGESIPGIAHLINFKTAKCKGGI